MNQPIKQIDVAFDAQQITSNPFSIAPNTIEVGESSADIVLGLRTLNGGGQSAVFRMVAGGPLQWFKDGSPIPRPAAFSAPELKDGQLWLTFTDTNTVADETEYGFAVIVRYSGQKYTSPDPTIINMPPTR